jgi:F0F1-type ATP synthase membrane subunit b/b'
MYHDCKTIETDLNERLKNLVSKLTFKAINWKIKMIEGDLAGANNNLQEMEKILAQMKLYLSSYQIH